MIVYAMLLYPAIGALAGQSYPAVPVFGVAPCPLVIFTFGVLLLADPLPLRLLIVPLLWSLVGGSAALLLQVPQTGRCSSAVSLWPPRYSSIAGIASATPRM